MIIYSHVPVTLENVEKLGRPHAPHHLTVTPNTSIPMTIEPIIITQLHRDVSSRYSTQYNKYRVYVLDM